MVLRDTTVHLISDLIDDINDVQFKAIDSTNRSINNSIIILIVTNVIAIVSGITIMLFISWMIRRHLNKVIHMTSDVANGDLTVESIDYDSNDEIGQLAKAVNLMKDNIHRILFKVTDAAHSVSSSSEQLTQTTNDVNEGGEQIASTLQELSSAAEVQANSASDLSENMTRFVELVRQSEENGQDVMRTSEDVIQYTTEGTALMNNTVKQMNRIDTIVSNVVDQVQGLD